MKKDQNNTKKAPMNLPETEVKKRKQAPSNLPKKARSKAPQTGVGQKKGKTFLMVALMMIWVFCSVVVSQLVLGYLLLWCLGAEALSLPVWNGVYSVASYLLALVLIIFVPPRLWQAEWYIKHKDGRVSKGKYETKPASREELGLSGTPTWTDIGLSPIAFIVSLFGAGILTYLFQFFSWFNAEEVQETGFTPYMSAPEKLIAFITLVVAAPIVEEVIFRGWLYGKLRARLNVWVAIILVSLLFALMHFQWNVGVNVFALSVVLCGLREITGTIYAGILTHMIKNGLAFYLLYVMGL